jgi:methionyl-tRNA formyltransferase
MKIFALCNSNQLGLSAVAKLKGLGMLSGVGYLDRYANAMEPGFQAIGVEKDLWHAMTKDDWQSVLQKIITELEIDCVFVLTFPWKIPGDLLRLPPKGFVNFHYALLPKYKGADPIFWQIKNDEKEGGLTAHLMSEELDEGPVILQEKIPFPGGFNYGIYCGQLAQSNEAWVSKIVTKLLSDRPDYIELEPVEEVAPMTKPGHEDLKIDWTNQTALEIEALINAANPRYGGADTSFSGQVIKILEVTPVDGNADMKGAPGEIVYSDLTYGPIVACINGEFLRVTIAHVAGAYLSGVKLTTLGFFKGSSFS